MRRPALLALGLLLGSAAAVQAQVRPVLSGEHGSFTRLSIPIPAGAAWTLDETADGAALVVPDGFDYDLGRVFDRIGRDRIARIDRSAEGLKIGLGCDCSVSSFLFRDRYVVIDVDDTPRKTTATSTSTPPAGAPLAVRDAAIPLVLGIDGVKVVQGAPTAGPADVQVQDAPDLRDVQRQLSDALRDAAGRDILVNRDTAELVGSPPPDPAVAPPVAPPIPYGALENLPGLTIRTGTELRDVQQQPEEQSICWPQDYADVLTWVEPDRPVTTVLSERRSVLTNTLGAADPSAIADLARAYIYFGFGAEAALALDLDDSDSRARQALRAMAELIDDSGPGSALASQVGCDGPVSLWAYLSSPAEASAPANIGLVFKGLPAGLRLALGGRLALALARDGRLEESDQVLNSASTTGSPARDQGLNSVLIALETQNGPTTPERIETALSAGASLTPEVLVTLADRALAAGIAPPDELIARLEDSMFIDRDTPRVVPLKDALVRSLSALDRHIEAFDLAQPVQDPVPDELTTLRSGVVKAAARRADVATVIQIAFHPQASAVDADAQNALARRLLDLGFPEEAGGFLEGPAQGGTMGERRYLRAEVAVALGDMLAASQILAGITTPRAEAILAGADWDILRTEPVARDGLAWRQSDWTELADSEDAGLQDLARLATRPAPQLSTETPLTSGLRMAEEAAEARATLEQGLNRFTVAQD